MGLSSNEALLLDVRDTTPSEMTLVKQVCLQWLVQRAHLIPVDGFFNNEVGGLQEMVDLLNTEIEKGGPAVNSIRTWWLCGGLEPIEGKQTLQLPQVPREAIQKIKDEKDAAERAEKEKQRASIRTRLVNDSGYSEENAAALDEAVRGEMGDESESSDDENEGDEDVEVVLASGSDWNVMELKNTGRVFYLSWTDDDNITEAYQMKVAGIDSLFKHPIRVLWACSEEDGGVFKDDSVFDNARFLALARPDMLTSHRQWLEEIQSFGNREFFISFDGINEGTGEEESGIFKARVKSIDPNGHVVTITYKRTRKNKAEDETLGIQSFMKRLKVRPPPAVKPKTKSRKATQLGPSSYGAGFKPRIRR